MGVFQIEVHGLPADTAHGLCCVDPLAVLLKLGPVSYSSVQSLCCHTFITNTKGRAVPVPLWLTHVSIVQLKGVHEKPTMIRTGVEPVSSLRIIMRTSSSPLVVTWSPVVYQPLTLSLYK